MTISENFKAETARLGFPLSGITLLTQPTHWQAYQQWINLGLHAGMAYLSRDVSIQRRANPHLIQADAISLLVVAMHYPSPESVQPIAISGALGRVAAYAWGVDYHEILVSMLKDLIKTLEQSSGGTISASVYSDTGPVLERDFAQKAGLGWAGKNTCLISPRYGSYFLLAEALVNVEIEPDSPFSSEHCGSCRRCIESCPTAAIREDRTIDSCRCIAYQTIENKGPIPVELRPSIGNWVFGCDICQQVCPWNRRFAAQNGHPGLEPKPEEFAFPNLRSELALTPHEFNRKFKHNPIQRARRRGYLRNIAVAIGNSGDRDCVPELIHALENEPEPLVRGHTAWALGRINTAACRQALEKSFRIETDSQVLLEIKTALEQ